jgi:hypothetical protein
MPIVCCHPNKVVRRATPYPVALSPLKLKIISLDHVTTDKTKVMEVDGEDCESNKKQRLTSC